MTKTGKSSAVKEHSTTTKRSREEDQALCPICDDVCTCGKQPPSRPTLADHRRRAPHPTTRNTFYRSNKSGAFIWDFNVRGHLIPLESLYEQPEEFGDDKSFGSTDAECSDLVSGSESGDHLSEVLSADSEDDTATRTDPADDDMMIYYPVDTPSLKKSHGGDGADDNHGDLGSVSSKISAITPQVLAAISKSLSNLPPKTCVLLVSDDAESSSFDELNDDDDIEMIIVFSSDDDDDNNNNNDNSGVEGEKSDSDCESLLQRFRRVPVNAFYRSKMMRAATNHHNPHHGHTANALRPCSVDPQFIHHRHSNESSGDDHLVRADGSPEDGEGDSGDSLDTLQFDAPLIYY